uniref:Adenylate cyclase n=1 Tax=mine drainage metagenome TaxID=410659 RepID=E6PYV7_9ZZZZ
MPETEADRATVLEQLDRVLAHPLFIQSKRYPALLRFVVEQSLAGRADQIKERLIGMEVFGRAPDYDANADPVVRVTAGETRKRLAQYYYEPEHSSELRIELPTGAYVPQFVWPAEGPVAELPPPDETRKVETADTPSAASSQSVRPEVVPWTSPSGEFPVHAHSGAKNSHAATTHLVATVLLVVSALLAGLAGGYWYHTPKAQPPVDHTVQDFWASLTSGPATVTICLGEPARDTSDDGDWSKPIERTVSTEPLYVHLHLSGLFALADVITLTRIEPVLLMQNKPFRVSAASEASFGELREGPVVLVGAFDNLWTMRLTQNLRFGFESVNGTASIVDRRSKTKTTWATAWDLPYERLARDYAIVARFRDPLTGQPVMIASGISEEGTEAAGELISNASDLEQLLKNAPANWRTMNMEAVIETRVIDGHSGPPKVSAVEFWP